MLEVRVIREVPGAVGVGRTPYWGVYDTDKRGFAEASFGGTSRGLLTAKGLAYETRDRVEAERFKQELEKKAVAVREVVNKLRLAQKDEKEAETGYFELANSLRKLGYHTGADEVVKIGRDEGRHAGNIVSLRTRISQDYSIPG